MNTVFTAPHPPPDKNYPFREIKNTFALASPNTLFMKNIFRLPLLLTAILFAAASCKKAVPDQTKYIPKDAAFVFDLNWKSLSDKVAKGHISWDSLFHSAVAEQESDTSVNKMRKEVSDFIHSGIDTTSNVFFFVKTGGSMMSGQSMTEGAVAALKDRTSFEAYVKKHDNAPQIQKGDNFSYADLGDGVAVGWNEDIVILAGAQAQPQRYFDTSGNFNKPPGAAASPQQMLTTFFNQKEEESVASIPEFRDLMNEKADMLFWSNSGSIINANPVVGLTKLGQLFKDSYGAGTINFEDGKVSGNFKSYSGKDLADIWKKYSGPTVNMDMVNKYPFPVSGFVVFSFNPQVITEILKYAGMDNTVNQFLQKQGFTLDDITKAFKGDFAIVFSDISTGEKEYEYNGMKIRGNRPTAKVVFNATIADKNAYNKIMSKLADQGWMELKNGQYVPAAMGSQLGWNMDGKNLVIATDSELLQQYLSGKGNAAIPSGVESDARGKAAFLYVDINKILLSASPDTMTHPALDAAKNTFKNAFASSDNFNGKFVQSSFELNTVNNKENSLVSLIRFFGAISQKLQMEEKRLKGAGMGNIDSMQFPVPVPDTGK